MAERVVQAVALDRQRVRSRAQECFGFQRMVDDYVALYRQLR
jgi:hypothetical protein